MDENTLITLCRLCLENGAHLPIFGDRDGDKNYNIQSKITLCLKEKIEDIDGYPRLICQNCIDILDATCNFINKYRETCKILENGVDVLKHEHIELNSLNCQGQSDEEFESENIKYEYIHDVNDLNDQEEEFKPIKIKLKLPIENKILKSTKRRCSAPKKRSKQVTNKIASSILEGEFAWNGDTWCLNSTKNNGIEEKRKLLLNPKSAKRKTIKIKMPNIKKPAPLKLCDLCGEVFKSQDRLSLHKKNVHYRKSVKCVHCLRLFVSNYYLSRHIQRKHNEEKNFICAICGRGFAFKGELSSHNKNVHNKHLKPKKQFKCKICNKMYKCGKSVIIHERSAHTGQRPAVCSVCGSSFYHDDYLKEHMRLHTGETPFKCPICGRGYAQRCNMKSHLRIHKKSELDAGTLSKLRPNYLRLLKE